MVSLGEFCRNSLVTETRKIVDDSLKFNAENASGAGLEIMVTRTYDGVGVNHGKDQCIWCLERCGKNMTLDEAYEKGAFQRHDGCGCLIEYVSKKGERTYQAGKSSRNNWLSEEEFRKRVNTGLDGQRTTPKERIINAAIEMQAKDKQSRTLVGTIVKYHEALICYNPADMKRRLERAGFHAETLKRSLSGFNSLGLDEGGGYIVHFGNDGVMQFHPEGGLHKIAYWKINNGKEGRHWYDTEGREHFFGAGH